MKLARRFGWPAVSAAIVLVVLLSLPEIPTSRALGIWVVFATAVVLLVLNRHARDRPWTAPAPRFEQALRRRKARSSPQPEELLHMEREIVLGSADADHAHRRLLPLLRGIAAARIASRHGFELERRPEAARALLGEDAWELLRPDRREPEDRHAPGLPHESIVAVIERVEAL
ncbi:MAG: hypothetical protein WAL31_05495 [Gaiellaceae bacterium]